MVVEMDWHEDCLALLLLFLCLVRWKEREWLQ